MAIASEAKEAAKVRFDLRLVINNIDYPGIYENITSNGHFVGL